MSKSQRDAQRDKVAWEHVEFPCSTLDWRVDFRHAPARLRVDANMFGLACGYAAVCVLRALWFAQGAKRARCAATSVVGPKTYAQSLAELTNIQVCQPAR